MSKEITPEEQLKAALLENESLKKENADVKAENTTVKKENAAMLKKVAATEEQISDQDEIIKDLQSKLEAAASVAEKSGGALVVTHAKENYKVLVSSFKFKGNVHKAEDLKKDSKLVKALVEAGVGFLVKL